MYAAYFGLTEPPFSIAPDPRYLYLSERHSEARAHLLYGLEHGGGFVQLTGEVGTGKTTLCRSVMAALPESIEVALILNPRISEHELLQSLCDELRINYPPGLSTKQIVDRLNHHLLRIHAEGRRTVLIIDEAQNLSREVLEQVRLLTNLETNKEKLLRIVLIGQPELSELLARPDLRQLSQRITARYHLSSLSQRETAAFIKHRLSVAGCDRALFSDRAVNRVYRFSKGVPRLINLVCDRALLGAYAENKRKVSAGIVTRAAKEVLGKGSKHNWFVRPAWWFGLLFVGLLLPVQIHFSDSISGYYDDIDVESAVEKNTSKLGFQTELLNEIEQLNADLQLQAAEPIIVDSVAALPLNSYADAMSAAVVRWGGDEVVNDCADMLAAGLQCYYREDGLNGLRRYNRPAVLILNNHKRINYPFLLEISGNSALLEISERQYLIPWSAIEAHWNGRFILLWRPPVSVQKNVADSNNTAWLRRAVNLWSMQTSGVTSQIDSDATVDERLKKDIKEFQLWHDIAPSGVVGVDTLIELNTVLAGGHIPALVKRDDRR